MPPTTYSCRYCGRQGVSRSLGGLKSHISQSPLCRQKRDDEHRHLPSLKRKREPLAEPSEIPTHLSDDDNASNTGGDADGGLRSKRLRTEESQCPSGFQPTTVVAIVDYPEEKAAGAVIEGAGEGLGTRFQQISQKQQAANEEPWSPFNSLSDWELARWLMQSSVSQGEIDKFLKLEAVRTCDHLIYKSPLTLVQIQTGAQPSSHNKYTFFKKIDALPKGPEWVCEVLEITGDKKDEEGKAFVEEVEFWRRDPVECVRELIGNPAFKEFMKYAPERHYEDKELTIHIYNEMATGDWWWEIQVSVFSDALHLYMASDCIEQLISGKTPRWCYGCTYSHFIG